LPILNFLCLNCLTIVFSLPHLISGSLLRFRANLWSVVRRSSIFCFVTDNMKWDYWAENSKDAFTSFIFVTACLIKYKKQIIQKCLISLVNSKQTFMSLRITTRISYFCHKMSAQPRQDERNEESYIYLQYMNIRIK